MNNKELKSQIRAKLKSEWVKFSDYDNAIIILSNCVMWEKLIKEYKSYFVDCFNWNELQHIPKNVFAQIEWDYR